MGRIAAVLGLAVALCTAPAEAGQTSASFQVGVTIVGPGHPAKAKAAARRALRYTWGAAGVSVAKAGFQSARKLKAEGEVYWFAARRGGQAYRVAVSQASGAIVKVMPA
jgi:hypothetical protein